MPARASLSPAGQRIDKWLWYTRVVKTRSLAGNLARGGRIRVNGVRVTKPSTIVRPGDVVTFVHNRVVRTLEVVLPGKRRGPPVEAITLYCDLAPQPARSAPARRDMLAPGQRAPGSGRPTKKQRRAIDHWLEDRG